MSWITFSSRSSKPGRRLCEKGNASGAQAARRLHKLQHFKNNLYGVLGALRTGAALQRLGILVPLILFGGAQSQAFPNIGVNLGQAIQKQNTELNKTSKSDGFEFGILGSVEFKTGTHRFQDDWQGVLARIGDETDIYERCSISAIDCPPKVRQWRELLQSLKGLPVKVQLARLNKSINRMASYADDDKIFGKKDHWATPLEFLEGKGDCEDFAAVKFWSLLELGFTSDQLRLAVVRDRRRKIMHAIVTVETGDGTFVLDSLFDHPVEQRYVLKYAPIFSANLENNWVHIVTRKIRVSYINHVENLARGRVIPVNGSTVGAASVKSAGFVDWT